MLKFVSPCLFRYAMLLVGIIFLLTININCLVAQTQQKEDVVYLKNGGLVRGRIVENIPGLKVVIKSSADNIYTFTPAEIEKITQETVEKPLTSQTIRYKVPDWYGVTELGATVGGKELYDAYSNLNGHIGISAGYIFHRFAAIGLACNMDWYRQFGVVSIAGEYRGELLKNKPVTPYWHIMGGYGFPTNQDVEPQSEFETGYEYTGGLLWQAGGGVHFRSKNRLGWLLGAGFQYQTLTERQWQTSWGWESKRKWDFNRLIIKVGLSF